MPANCLVPVRRVTPHMSIECGRRKSVARALARVRNTHTLNVFSIVIASDREPHVKQQQPKEGLEPVTPFDMRASFAATDGACSITHTFDGHLYAVNVCKRNDHPVRVCVRSAPAFMFIELAGDSSPWPDRIERIVCDFKRHVAVLTTLSSSATQRALNYCVAQITC